MKNQKFGSLRIGCLDSDWMGQTDLFTSFLEHVLLSLRHQLPLLTAQNHSLCAWHILHVYH